jgi:CheY-like chemotaxis protein
MNGFIGMMHLINDTELDDDQRLYAKTATTTASCLLELISDVLDFSKIDAGRLDLELRTIELRPLLSDIIHILNFQAEQKGLTLASTIAPDVPVHVRADRLRLRQVLTNLLSNALKFTKEGRVELAVRSVGRAGDGALLRFSVSDTGPGLSASEQAVIFDAFRQADASTTREFGGTGLGLSISRQLVELMGGRLAVDSSPGQGSEFHFTAPFAVATSAPGETGGAPLPAPFAMHRHLNLLVAEDTRVNQLVIERLLGKAGHKVTLVANGREAVEARAAGTYDALLLDLQMPIMGGIEAARTIRAHESAAGLPRLPIIALTADVFDGVRERCEEAGMEGYLSKPIDPYKLQGALADLAGTPPPAALAPQTA